MRRIAAWICIGLLPLTAMAEERFPMPQFEAGYRQPAEAHAVARAGALEVLDIGVLIVALSLASYLALRRRSRHGLILLAVFSLLYFGFWRKGCICPVGSVQNVSAWFFDSTYVLPLSVAFFFALPLLFTLFFGRTFCAAVCPLGAIQDLVVLKPVTLPALLSLALGLLPAVYLGLAVLLAATGGGFVICRYDPFVAFFRFSGDFTLLLLGAFTLLLGVFLARPYCRFACPYGVLLGWFSRASKWHVTITPDECIRCRLCEDACPFDAILRPNAEPNREARPAALRRLTGLLLLLPVLALAGAWLGGRLAEPLSRLNPTVALAHEVAASQRAPDAAKSLELEAFRATGVRPADLAAQALSTTRRFRTGSILFGAFTGLVIGGRLIAYSVRRRREDYEPDREACLSCARCFLSCPKERKARGMANTDAAT